MVISIIQRYFVGPYPFRRSYTLFPANSQVIVLLHSYKKPGSDGINILHYNTHTIGELGYPDRISGLSGYLDRVREKEGLMEYEERH